MIHDPFLDPPRRQRPGCARPLALVLGFWIAVGLVWPTETAAALFALLVLVLVASVAVIVRARAQAARNRRALFTLLDNARGGAR